MECSGPLRAAVDDQGRCSRYLMADAFTVASMACKTMAARYNAMAQEYALCSSGATEFEDNNPAAGKVGDECKSEGNRAIWSNAPLTDNVGIRERREGDGMSWGDEGDEMRRRRR